MKIIEKTVVRNSDIPLLKNLISSKINKFSFTNHISISQAGDVLKFYSAEIIVSLNEIELIITNHYHESNYNTGLKYLFINERVKSNRPYNSNYINESYNLEISKVEIWGINNIKEYWDLDKIQLYKKKGLLPQETLEVSHYISSQHIIRIVLSNDGYIIFRSDSPKNLIAEFYPAQEKSGINILEKNYFRWNNFK